MKFIGKSLLLNVEGKKILCVADLHLGYEEVLLRSGVNLPNRIFEETLENLGDIFDLAGKVDEFVILGDLKHEFGRFLHGEREEIYRFFEFVFSRVERVVFVKGNHDVIVKDMKYWERVEVVDYYLLGDCAFVHGDRDFEILEDKKIKRWFMGHLHPAIAISDGVKSEMYKCFLIGKFKGREIVILPSFFSANEGMDPREQRGNVWDFNFDNFEVEVVDGLKTRNFGKLKNIG